MQTAPEINFRRACPAPVALVIVRWEDRGVTIAKADADGALYGCRDITYGPSFDSIVAAWISDAEACGLAVEWDATLPQLRWTPETARRRVGGTFGT